MDDQGPKIRALREALGLTQAQVTERLGVTHAANWVLRAEKRSDESTVNKLSHDDQKEAMARGLGLSLADFKAYLSGRIALDETVNRSAAGAGLGAEALRPAAPARPPAAHPRAEDGGASLEHALGLAFNPRRHTVSDLRAVQDALGTTYRWERPEAEFVEGARAWLDAAASLRGAGQRVDAVAILDRVTFGRSERSRQVGATREAAANVEGDAAADELGLVRRDAPTSERPVEGTERLPSETDSREKTGVHSKDESERLIAHARRVAKGLGKP